MTTRRVLAIRVSFPQEIPDEETTSGDGTFDLRTYEDAVPDYRFPFDTPPHNRSYFSAHFRALANYFATASGGALAIAFDVLPAGDNDSYILERRLIDYGNGRTRQEVNARIVELFRDGVLAADALEGAALDFSDYDDIVVIHAGLGGESSNQLNDIPSAFVNREDLDIYTEGPVSVDNGSHLIEQGILLPESGGTDGRSGLNGILARFYANQLGLPRLDNPEDGLPAIGDWSLMDTGNITVASSRQLGLDNLTGEPSDTILVAYAPSLPTAWSRIRLGWLTPEVIRKDTTISIAASHSTTGHPKAVRIPITADEYFLLENRMSRLAVEGRRPTITLSEGIRGVWEANDDYDAFIPGSGILIWHVDDAVVRASTGGKAVNSNIDYRIHFDGLVGLYRKGLSLEEADGLEDIGNTSASRVITSGIISFASISGGAQDPYYVGNATRFGTETIPSSESNTGYGSGIEIEILGPPGEVMEVSIRFSQHDGQWPRSLASPTPAVAPRALISDALPTAILNGGARSGGDGTAWLVSGEPAVLMDGYESAVNPAVGHITQSGNPDILIATDTGPAVWTAGGVRNDPSGASVSAVSTSPLAAAFPGKVTNDIWGHEDGRVRWGVFGTNPGERKHGNAAITGLAAGEIDGDGITELVALDAGGAVVVIDGEQQSTQLGVVENAIGSPVIGNFDGTGHEDVAVLSATGSVTVFSDLADPITSRPVPGGAASSPILSDLDGDGFVEILFGGDGRIWVIRFNGVAQTDTPYELPLKDRVGTIDAPPIVADLDDDGALDLVVATQTGAIYAIANSGVSLPGFPILATGPISVSPLLDDLDGDNTLELVAFTDEGTAHLWHLEQLDSSLTGSSVSWGQQGGDAGNASRLAQTVPGIDAPISQDLLPARRAYCYPNPIRGNDAYIRFFLSDVAEVNLTIVNAVGQIVVRISAVQPDPGTDNEIHWDTTNYASGVYVCRIQATDGTRTQTRFIKTAVIR